MSKLLYGTDPECFAAYIKDGLYYADPPYNFRKKLGVWSSYNPNLSINHVDNKHPIFIEQDDMKMHEDGAAFEFSVPPSHDPRELFERVQVCRNLVNTNILAKFPDECLPELQFLPTINFELERWKNEGEDFVYATRAGCDPDIDVYNTENRTSDGFEPEADFKNWPKRYSGGHIHVSGSPNFILDYEMAVRCMAMTTGLAAIFYSDVPELEHDRTYRFGKPGRCRVQNYGADNPYGKSYQIGIEYRTASSRWASDWKIASEVFRWAEIGVNQLFETSLGNELLGDMLSTELEKSATQAILNADQKTAGEILSYIESKL